MNLVRKHSIIIICILIGLLALTKCSSCSQKRSFGFERVAMSQSLDSIKSINVQLNDSIKVLNTKVESLKELNKTTKESLDHSRNTNNNLIKKLKK